MAKGFGRTHLVIISHRFGSAGWLAKHPAISKLTALYLQPSFFQFHGWWWLYQNVAMAEIIVYK